jgi:hypothetical protein
MPLFQYWRLLLYVLTRLNCHEHPYVKREVGFEQRKEPSRGAAENTKP